jgi:hypothetical protein
MQITYATEPGDDQPNEDFVLAGPEFVVVLDGATAPPGIPSGCIHNVRWLVRHLGGRLASQLTLDDTADTMLAEHLADAIRWVNAQHAHTCDLDNPASPSSTVALLRSRSDEIDTLVLSDSPILLDLPSGVRRIADERPGRLPSYKPEDVRDQRNQTGGFWVASTTPDAAEHAVQLTMPAEQLRRAAVLTDGATRLVERFHLLDWIDLIKILDTEGPTALIRRVRAAENTLEPAPGSRGKLHDDATAVLVQLFCRSPLDK